MSPLPPQDLAEACRDAMWKDDAASAGIGAQIDAIAPGEAVVSMTVRPDMANGHGTCHGGYIFTLADTAFAFACNSYNAKVVAQHCSITFVAPAHVGRRITATCTEVTRFGRNGIYDVTVRDEDGTLLAEFRGHSRVVKGTHLQVADEATTA